MYTDTEMPVNCKVAAGRDESDFYEALGIVGEGPLVAYTPTHYEDKDGDGNAEPSKLMRPPVLADLARVGAQGGLRPLLLGQACHRLEPLAGQLEALHRGDHADPLVGALGVVVGDPGVQGGLRLLRRGEHPPASSSAAQRLVEALDLAGGRRAARRREQVAGAVLSQRRSKSTRRSHARSAP